MADFRRRSGRSLSQNALQPLSASLSRRLSPNAPCLGWSLPARCAWLTPELGCKGTPCDQRAIRGTYSEAFRAPGPAETGGASFGFTSLGILSIGQPGIKPETAKSYTLGLIFEPFRQSESGASRGPGLGLGLAIVHRLVELHGGRVSAYSGGRNQGTTITVRLPMAWEPDAGS